MLNSKLFLSILLVGSLSQTTTVKTPRNASPDRSPIAELSSETRLKTSSLLEPVFDTEMDDTQQLEQTEDSFAEENETMTTDSDAIPDSDLHTETTSSSTLLEEPSTSISIETQESVEETLASDSHKTLDDTAPSELTFSIISEEEKTASITGHNQLSANTLLTIPKEAEIDGETYTITEIASGAFHQLQLSGLVFEEGSKLEKIGGNAFLGAFSRFQGDVIFPSSLVEVGMSAFASPWTDTLEKNFYFQSDELEIKGAAFRNSAVKAVEFKKDSQLSIGNEAFYNTQLTAVTFPSGLESIGDSAFFYNKVTKVVFEGSFEGSSTNVFGRNNIAVVNNYMENTFSEGFWGEQTVSAPSVRLTAGGSTDDIIKFLDLKSINSEGILTIENTNIPEEFDIGLAEDGGIEKIYSKDVVNPVSLSYVQEDVGLTVQLSENRQNRKYFYIPKLVVESYLGMSKEDLQIQAIQSELAVQETNASGQKISEAATNLKSIDLSEWDSFDPNDYETTALFQSFPSDHSFSVINDELMRVQIQPMNADGLVKVPELFDFGNENNENNNYSLEKTDASSQKINVLFGITSYDWQLGLVATDLVNTSDPSKKIDGARVYFSGAMYNNKNPDNQKQINTSIPLRAGWRIELGSNADFTNEPGLFSFDIDPESVKLSIPEDENKRTGENYSANLTWVLSQLP